MLSSSSQPASSNKIIGWFLLIWTVLNALQAITLGLHSDESYYWMYSRYLDWGYFDHPPMVALFIRIGDSIFHNELGVRLLTVLLNPLALYVLWLIAKRYKADIRWFVLLASSILVFHIYGFVTTPDVPLFFFAILFYYVYQRYLDEDKWQLALLLGIIVACLLYSKYHGLLIIIFTLLSNLKLLRRKTFYLIAAFAVALYLPHILWQIHHQYPSVVYQLFERSTEPYKFENTYLYLLGQLLMGGPLVGWFIFYYGFTTRIKNAFIRCLMVNAIGTFIFFLITTISGNVQPHWTLIGFVPLLLLVLIHLRQPGNKPAWLNKLAWINISLIVLFRVLLIVHFPPLVRWGALNSFFRFHTLMDQIHQKAGNAYVIFPSSFQDASEYNYYTRSLKGFEYDDYIYRRSQYNLWPMEDSLQHHSAILISGNPIPGLTTDSVLTVKGMKYFNTINNVRTFQRMDVQTTQHKFVVKPRQQLALQLTIINPYAQPVDFGQICNGKPISFFAYLIQHKKQVSAQQSDSNFNQLKIQPHQTGKYTFTIIAPTQPGRYDLVFSILTQPFSGTRNSRIVNFTVR